MWSSPLFWIAVAIALFWALGAYNRLMRLRSAVAQAFGGFDAHMVRLIALLGEWGAAQAVQPHAPERATAGGGGTDQDIAALQGATVQLGASLAVARARPLQPEAVAALSAARDVLHASWHKAMGREALAAARVEAAIPASPWQTRWDDHLQQNEQAIHVFNEAVAQYNAAVAQFPASVLAWVFGFKAARKL